MDATPSPQTDDVDPSLILMTKKKRNRGKSKPNKNRKKKKITNNNITPIAEDVTEDLEESTPAHPSVQTFSIKWEGWPTPTSRTNRTVP
jgi:hypothetical protein